MKITKILHVFMAITILVSSCTFHKEIDLLVQDIEDDLLPNTCGLYGMLIDINENPISGEVVWLGEVIWNEDMSEGSFVIDGGRSPSTITDDLGLFVFKNIKVTDYVIIIGNLEADPLILPKSPNSNEARIFNCTDGVIINTEEILITTSN